jgi:gas vesicle protein
MVMKEEHRNRKSSILMPVLVGSAVGAGIALLFAPKKGKELRKDLKQFAAKTGDQVADTIDKGRKVVVRGVEAGRRTYDIGTTRLDKLMHKKEKSLLVPIVASGIIGAGIAFLVAPKSGKDVREDIKRFAVDTRDKVVSHRDKGEVHYTDAITNAM